MQEKPNKWKNFKNFDVDPRHLLDFFLNNLEKIFSTKFMKIEN
jgi:hypothetical protein